MITRAVFSYFNAEESFSNKAGFNQFSDFLYTMALATLLANRHFNKVQIITSAWGEKLLKQVGIQATEYNTTLDAIKSISPWFWAYGKLMAYSQQTEPFVHIDNDVFLWKPLPQRISEAEYCFQSKEFMNVSSYKWYDVLKPCWNSAPVKPSVIVDNKVTDYAHNCGICGGHDLNYFKEWVKTSAEYIFAPENQDTFFKEYKNILMHQNLWHEQYFGSSLILSMGKRCKTEVISDNVCDLVKASNEGYTHLWGGIKKRPDVMIRVRKRLLKESPVLFEQVTAFINDYLPEVCPKDEVIEAVI
jgi:hypothetical protein